MAFGRGVFGEGPFGRADFARAVIYESVPVEQRRADQAGGSVLERILAPLEEELDVQVEATQALNTLRNPMLIRGRGVTETLNVVAVSSYTDPDFGPLFALEIDPLTPIDRLEPQWTYVLSSVRYWAIRISQASSPQYVYVRGVSAPAAGSVTFEAPSLLPFLASDFGIELDDNEPEATQRSAIRNIVQYLSWKGSGKGYRIRGEISGFDVTVVGLYAIPESWLSILPAMRTFRFTIDGVERYYTDIDPVFESWDDFPCDDDFGGAGPDADRGPMYLDSMFASGESPPLEYWSCRFNADVTAVAALSPAERALTGLAFGFKVTATVALADYELINWTTSPPVFTITDADGQSLFIESVLSWNAFTETIEIAVGVVDTSPPALGVACVSYSPRRESLCDWCKSHVVSVSISATSEVLDFYAGDALELSRAAGRLIRNFENLKPIHVRVGQYAIAISAEIELSPTVLASVDGDAVVAEILADMVYDFLGDEDSEELDTSVIVVYET